MHPGQRRGRAGPASAQHLLLHPPATEGKARLRMLGSGVYVPQRRALTGCACTMQGLISAHSWPPLNGGPSHMDSRVLRPPNMQMTWNFSPRMLAAPSLPPAVPPQQLKHGSVDIMRHLYKQHFAHSISDPKCASLALAQHNQIGCHSSLSRKVCPSFAGAVACRQRSPGAASARLRVQ